MLRLRVTKYFDSVINEIDLYTETKIQSIKTQTEEDWWNKRRQEQIDEMRRIERACLYHVNTLKVEEKEIESGEWMKRAFVEYCFTVDYADLLYLVKANRFVEPREKRFLDVHLHHNGEKMNIPIKYSQKSLGVTIEEFEVNLGDYFLTDAPVIDISSGLDQCCRVKWAGVSAAPDTERSPIYLEDLTIQKCSLSFRTINAGEEKEAANVIKCLMKCRDHIDTITIHLEYFDHLDPSPEMKALVQSVELNGQVRFNFSKKHGYFQEFDPSGLFEKHKIRSNLLVKVVNWQFISDISFDTVWLEDLEKADLSSLHSLTYLHLKISSTGKSSTDWMFLDACRASLEDLYMSCYEPAIPVSLSCRTFSGMTKLKCLSLSGSFSVELDDQEELFADLTQLESLDIRSTKKPFMLSWKMFEKMASLKSLSLTGAFSIQSDNRDQSSPNLDQLKLLSISAYRKPFPLSRKTFCPMTNLQELRLTGAFSIETSIQEELFADLIHLKKLVLYVEEQMWATKWLIYSPTIEELRLCFLISLKASTEIRFKLPKLDSLELSLNCDRIECDLTDMMSCFSHVKKLAIKSSSFDITTKGWFHKLTCVEELELNIETRGHINSQLFEGFDNLTKLKIYFGPDNILDSCALQKLAHLETIILHNNMRKYKPFDTEDKSIFNGLNSLKTIEYSVFYPCSRSYVYFENLGRFILIVM